MRLPPLIAALAFVIVGAISPAKAAANEAKDAAGHSGPADGASGPAAKPSSPAGAKSETSPVPAGPPDAAAALVRAAAAYDYGDMNQVVESARYITEGSLEATQWQQVQAFRLLGIGLYLTNRPLGAEAAFSELLRKEPRARLDPTTTRPEIVAFFESLRHQHIAKQRSTRKMIWNFIPPAGQFQNDDNIKGWVLLGLGLAAGATCATSYALFKSWELPNDRSKHEDTADTMRTVNTVGWAVLAAVYIYGVADGLIGYGKPIDDPRPPVSLHFFPGGGGLGFTF
jgi:hypothetical protein